MKKVDLVLPESVLGFINEPDKYVYPFIIKEKNGKERTIITYNKLGEYGPNLRSAHEKLTESFKNNFHQRNIHSFAYHSKIRSSDALTGHMKSNLFIKLDIHHFFESITEEAFFLEYGEYFNEYWKKAIKGFFYRGALSIGFVSSPIISDFYMKKFDKAIEEYINNYPELHYSRYSDDILLSSELDDAESLNNLFEFVVDQLHLYRLEVNEKKTRRMKLDYESHNSISYLGLNISKSDSVNNKVTISKRYILFLLFLIEKQKGYKDHCYPLDNEIKSRIAYLAYNSPISYARFQKKYTNIYGEPYDFMPKELENRATARVTTEIPHFEEYSKLFKINIHKKIVGVSKHGFFMNDAIEIEAYLGKDLEQVEIPYFVDSIGPKAFYNVPGLKRVILNKKLKHIDIDAFALSSIEEIDLPESLRVIDARAFKDTKLRIITIPSNVKSIGKDAFSRCFQLENVSISEGVENIEEGAFSQGGLRFIHLPSTLKQINANAFASSEYLESINLKESQVEAIGKNAFYECHGLKEVILPESLLTIGKDAFKSCHNLRNVYIPASVIEIDKDAFSSCPSLECLEVSKDNKIYEHRNDNASLVGINDKILYFTLKDEIDKDIRVLGTGLFENRLIKEIDIPEGVTSIQDSVFSRCLLLKKVSLPKSLVSIGENSFYHCISLEEIALPERLKKIQVSAFASCPRLRKVRMSDSVTHIGDKAFMDDKLLEISLPANLVEIGQYAFKNCLSTKHLYIPSRVKEIRKDAFIGLSQVLESIKVDPLNTHFGSGDDNILYNCKKGILLLGCKNSKIKQGIKTIYKYAFAYCEGLTKLDLPDTVKLIEEGAFIGCSNLKDINLNIVSKIGPKAFMDDISLEKINLPTSITELGDRAFYHTGLKVFRIPNSITKFGKEVFDNCENLEELYISSTIDTDDFYAYRGCPNINHIEVDINNHKYDSRYNCNGIVLKKDNIFVRGCNNSFIPNDVIEIADNAFAESNLETIIIPKNVKRMSGQIFAFCKKLKAVEINAHIKLLPGLCFLGCSSLEEVVINSPEIVNIGNGAFSHCKSLKNITLPDTITEISTNAFEGSGLEEIHLPYDLKHVGFFAFANCENLKEVDIPEGCKATIFTSAFAHCKSLKCIKLPKSLEGLNGAQIFEGSGLEEISIPESKFTSIGAEMFANCHNLKKVTLPKGITTIERKAFFNCDSLDHINIPNGVTHIKEEAFRNCTSLEILELPETLVEISRGAFAGCVNLKSIKFPPSLKVIGPNAFDGCKELYIPELPEGLLSIGIRAFAENKVNKEILLPKSLLSLGNTAFLHSSVERIEVDFDNKFFKEEGNSITYIDEKLGKCLLLGFKDSIIPNDVKVIKAYAFYDVEGLNELVLPDSVELIERYAFNNCVDLQRVVLSKNLKEICNNAFSNCPNLKDIVFNDNLETINYMAFFNTCVDELSLPSSLKMISSLPDFKKIKVDKANERYESFGSTGLFDRQNRIVLSLHENIDIPGYTKFIGNDCYKGMNIDKLFIPEGVEIIDTNFEGSHINELYLPSSLKRLHFSNTTYIKKIFVHEDNAYYSSSKDHLALLNKHQSSLLYLCDNGVTPEGVTSISNYVVREGREELYIPSSVVALPSENSYHLVKKVRVDKDNPVFEQIDNTVVISSNKSLLVLPQGNKIPEGIKVLQFNAFKPGLKSIYIPASVQYMDIDCFRNAEDLEEIIVSKDNPIFDSRDNCNAVIVTKSNIVIARCKNSIIPEGVNEGKFKKLIERLDLNAAGLFVENKPSSNEDEMIKVIMDEGDDLPF